MMRTALAGLALLALTTAAVAQPAKRAATTAHDAAPATVADAPADEYFGPFKYSALSTRTKIDALGRAYRERWADDASIVHDAGMVQSSLDVWAQRYPKDRWLAPTAFHLAQLYMEVQTDDARQRARATFSYVAKTFPNTKEGHLAKLRLLEGFPALHAEAPVSPTPSPYAPRPQESGPPGELPTAAPSTSPMPTGPTSAPGPSSAPAPTTAPA